MKYSATRHTLPIKTQPKAGVTSPRVGIGPSMPMGYKARRVYPLRRPARAILVEWVVRFRGRELA